MPKRICDTSQRHEGMSERDVCPVFERRQNTPHDNILNYIIKMKRAGQCTDTNCIKYGTCILFMHRGKGLEQCFSIEGICGIAFPRETDKNVGAVACSWHASMSAMVFLRHYWVERMYIRSDVMLISVMEWCLHNTIKPARGLQAKDTILPGCSISDVRDSGRQRCTLHITRRCMNSSCVNYGSCTPRWEYVSFLMKLDWNPFERHMSTILRLGRSLSAKPNLVRAWKG